MKIWILSDLHNESLHSEPWLPESIPDADVCICAGDIDRGARESVDFMAAQIRPHMPVVGVLGNHEFYGHTVEREISEARHWGRRRDVSMLENDTTVIDGTRFIGAVLWSDFALQGTPAQSARAALEGMSDYEYTGTKLGSFTPGMSAKLHAESLAYIESVLATPFDGDTVIVTHHSPSPQSIDRSFSGDLLNPAYHSNLEWLIEKYQPALWVHGHTHSNADYDIGSTRVICNPRGYGMENRRGFDPGLVVEIGGYHPKPPGL